MNLRLKGIISLSIVLLASMAAWAQGQYSKKGETIVHDSIFTSVEVDDAFVYGSDGGDSWLIGTNAIEMKYNTKNGALHLSSFKNKAASTSIEYITGNPIVGSFVDGNRPWVFKGGKASKLLFAGRYVPQLELHLEQEGLSASLFLVAYPGTSVIRQWIELKNTGSIQQVTKITPFAIPIKSDLASPFTHYWMVGGNSRADQGVMHSGKVMPGYQKEISGQATHDFVPWTAFHRGGKNADGWFAAIEYLGNWSFSVNESKKGSLNFNINIEDLGSVPILPGKNIVLPAVTICAFAGELDEMTVQSYNWQYRYMWDYTNMDYYAKPKWLGPWTYCAQNLQEQFAERLAYLNMNAEMMRSVGFEMLWDDAGWSSYNGMPPDNYGSVFTPTYEGPDFSITRRFLEKMNMGWLAWFARRPSTGVMAGKVGAWGDFEWRSDAVQFPDWNADRDWRDRILRFLDAYPGSSFHTCSGGSSYSHTFDIQRFANTNYFADLGRGATTNYFFSYFEPPDKWVDIIEPWQNGGNYKPATSRQTLTMVPFWGLRANDSDLELLRQDLDTYKYLLWEGVAGRWSYMFHPKIKGDEQIFYAQRTSYNREKACIILKHQAPGPITIYPYGLLPEHNYEISFDLSPQTSMRTGKDVMENGVTLSTHLPGELIYLGLPNRPRGNRDKQAPNPPGQAIARTETNLGYAGIGVYWSAGNDNNWVSSYEVRRGRRILGKVAFGTYYFDRSDGWNGNEDYAVRTLDGDGNVSDWVSASALKGESITATSLGGLFEQRGREGWYAETTVDGVNFQLMTWVRPAKTSSADEGGTPNQPGGIEGWWEGFSGARLGRAWMQSSRQASSVRTWMAPKNGKVRIVGRVMKEWYRQASGTPMNARISIGTKQVWPEKDSAVIPLNNIDGVTHDVTVSVNAGDMIRFILGRCDNPEMDIAAWMPMISYVGEEASSLSGDVVRILCGAESSYTDLLGNVWNKDAFFTGGKSKRTSVEIAGTDDKYIYGFGRTGEDFTYSIPVKRGLYAVRLRFAEPEYDEIFSRPFNTMINGQQVLRDFDICQDAKGGKRVKDRVFHYVVPNADGKIELRFYGGFDPGQKSKEAIVQAIEILPEIKPVIRVNCGSGENFVDWNSFVWNKDHDLKQGKSIQSTNPVAQATPTLYDQQLYRTARSGKEISYSFSVPQGLYAVHLKFAELWLKEPGKRKMNIVVNGQTIWKDWDPLTVAGEFGMAIDLRANNITPDKNGNITIRVDAAGENDAIIQGIEIQ